MRVIIIIKKMRIDTQQVSIQQSNQSTMPSKQSSRKSIVNTQPQLARYPLLAKPLDEIGKLVSFPGSFWQGQMTDAEKKTRYKCAVRDFTVMHTWVGGRKSQAFEMQEMGSTGTGSLELGDASGEIFFVEYPFPFLEYYYFTFPLPATVTTERTPAAKAISAIPVDLDEDDAVMLTPDQHPNFPMLRIGSAPVFKFMTVNSDKLVEAGPKSGQFCAEFQCCVKDEAGSECGRKRTVFHRRNRGVATSNLIEHMKAKAPTCTFHEAALKEIQAASKNYIELDGETMPVWSFSEAFPHHVKLMWLRAAGLSEFMTGRDEFRDYARGLAPCVRFPDARIIHRLAEVTDELQVEKQISTIKMLKRTFKGGPCLGLQLDMWTDANTHSAFAAINMSWIEEPKNDGPKAQLKLASNMLEFAVFPFGTKTAEHIKSWFEGVRLKYGIDKSMITGACPDGAADGQAALADIEEVGEKVDTCDLHRLQRAVLMAAGLAGSKSKNSSSKALLKKHQRQAQLSNQSSMYNKSLKDAQIEAGVPLQNVLQPVRTMTTRWGNQYKQLEGDALLRPGIDGCLEKYKRENKGNKEAIIESNESDQGSKVGVAVAASELGLTAEDWENSIEMEAWLKYPFMIKDTIENVPYCTGAQSMALLWDLKTSCRASAALRVKLLPPTLKMADRERTIEVREGANLGEPTSTGRTVMAEELQARVFDARPSNMRLVQCIMSKQMKASIYLSTEQFEFGKTIYLMMLRQAVSIAAVPTRASPPRAAKKAKIDVSDALFGGGGGDITPASPARTTQGADVDFDPVADEVARWASLEKASYQAFYDDKGLLNEFAMMWALRERFPLHFVLFKQTACHIPHEANVERLFSRAGNLSDPNMDTHFLATLTRIGFNKFTYKPSWETIKAAYFAKYRGVEDPDNMLDLHGSPASPPAPSSAPGTSASHAAA